MEKFNSKSMRIGKLTDQIAQKKTTNLCSKTKKSQITMVTSKMSNDKMIFRLSKRLKKKKERVTGNERFLYVRRK